MKTILQKQISDNNSGRTVMAAGQHFLFWIISYLFFVLFFGRANRDYQTTIIFSSMLFPLAIITGYFLNYFLIPRYFYKGKFWHFLLFLIYTLIFTLWSEVLISMFVFVFVIDFQLYKLDPTSLM